MNILLINHYSGSIHHGMEYRPYYMAQEWIKAGHSVRIVASSESHYGRTSPKIDGKNVTFEDIDDIKYVWLKTRPYKGNGVSRVINMLSFVAGLYRWKKQILKDFDPDVVIASSTYTMDIFPARHIAKKYAAKLVFEVHDLWPLTPMKLGGMSKSHPFIMMLQAGENYYCKHADKVVSMLPRADKHLLKHGMAAEKYITIPNGIKTDNWVEDDSLVPDTLKKLISKLRADNHFIVGYTGALGIANAMGVLLEAASQIQNEKISFVLVGAGNLKQNLIEKAKELGLSNIYFHDTVKKQAVPAILAQFDAAYLGWNRSDLYQFGISPNKLMDYMMAARPVIHSVDAANDLVAESQCGISVEPENPQSLAKALLELKSKQTDELIKIGKRGRDYVYNNLDYPVLADRFINAIK